MQQWHWNRLKQRGDGAPEPSRLRAQQSSGSESRSSSFGAMPTGASHTPEVAIAGTTWNTSSEPSCRSGNSRPTRVLTREELEKRLRRGQTVRRYIRCRVSGTLVTFGLFFGVGSQLIAPQSMQHDQWHDKYCPLYGVVWTALTIGICILSSAPLPGDGCLARLIIALNMSIIGYHVQWLIHYGDLDSDWDMIPEGVHDRPCTVDILTQSVVDICIPSLFLLMSFGAMLCRDPSRVQRWMWVALRTHFALQLAWEVLLWLLRFWELSCQHCWYSFVLADAIGLSLSCWTGLWNRVQAALGGLFDRARAETAAASIAGLIGDCEMRIVFSQASARFRCIVPSKLSEGEMATRDPDPALYQRSVRARLGECDAFVSHSWSDDAKGKWEALQQWTSNFRGRCGREPTIWLDKCCIDQTNIDADLRCLPLFLNGCKEMVVLCGPTYFSRLWCVMELFTHYHMGLSRNRLTVLPVLREEQHDEDMAALRTTIDSFDVAHCSCRDSADREKLMQIILAAFGSGQAFNEELRAVLDSTGLDDGESWGSDVDPLSESSSSSDDHGDDEDDGGDVDDDDDDDQDDDEGEDASTNVTSQSLR